MISIKNIAFTGLLLFVLVVQPCHSEEALCVDGQALSYPCNDIDLIARVTLADFALLPSMINDVWGYVDLNTNTEYALVGLFNGVSVIDLSDAQNPVEVASIAGGNSSHRDIKVYQFFDQVSDRYKAYAYVSSDLNQGVEILDLNDLENSLNIVGTHFDTGEAHNVFISNVDFSTGVALNGTKAYIHLSISPTGGAFDIASLTNPIAPTLISSVGNTEGHDIVSFTLNDARAEQCQTDHNPCDIIVNFSGRGKVVEFWDVTNQATPVKISSLSYNNASYPHSGWISKDKQFVFFQDEGDESDFNLNTTMYTIDISDITSPNISNVWRGPTQAIDHNGMALGSHYFMSNYSRGLTVLDVSDANNPQHLAYFDTYPNNDNTVFEGAWGVYPFLPSGKILVTDMSNGLFILTLKPDAEVDVFTDNNTDEPVSSPTPTPQKSSGGSLWYLVMFAMVIFSRRNQEHC